MKASSTSPLLKLLTPFREYYVIVSIYSICISVLTLATPISVQSLVNTFSLGPRFQPILILSFILLGLLVVLGLVKSLQYLLVEYLQRKLYAKVTASIGYTYFVGNKKGELKDKSNRYFDVILIHKNLAFLVTDGVAMALQTFIGLLLITFYHPYFMVFSLIILIAIAAPIYFFGRKGLSSAIDESTGKYEVAAYIDSLAGEGEGQQNLEAKTEMLDNHIDRFLSKRARHFKTVFLQNILYVGLYAGLNALLLALGGYLVISGQLSVGQLVAAEIVVNAILGHFLYAKKYLESFYDMYAAIEKVNIFYKNLEEMGVSVSEKKGGLKNFLSLASIYSPGNYKKFFKRFVGGIVALSILLSIVPWQQFSRGYGRVLAYDPNDRVQKITATVGGVIEEWLVQDGQFVRKGDPIVRVVDNDPNYLVRLEVQRDAAVAKFEAAKEASDTGRLNFHRQEKLVKEGLSSKKEFEQAKIKYKKLRAEEAAAAASLAKAEVGLSRQQQQVVTAPRDGKILRVLLGSGTTNVKVGEPLVEFVPKSKENAVELFLDGNDLPLIFEGRKVRLQFEGWPAVQFSGWPSVAIGSFGGVVSVVDPSVSLDGTFRVLVTPDPEDSVRWPEQSILRQGARAVGIVVLDQVSAGYELWRQVNGFPKSMPETSKDLLKTRKEK